MPRGNKRYLELLDLAANATPDACAVWPGAVNTKGYPHLTVRYKQVQGHRVVAMLYHGEGAVAMHSCNNKRCVNPHHLRMGTQRENIRQAWADGLASVDKIRAGQERGALVRKQRQEDIEDWLAARRTARSEPKTLDNPLTLL